MMLIALFAAPSSAQDNNYLFNLNPDEQQLALDLLRDFPAWQELGGDAERLVVCDLQLIRDKYAPAGEPPPRRYALVTEYVYDTGLSIRSLVDLLDHAVVKVQSAPGALAGLSVEEGDLAKELALANPWLSEFVEQHGADNVQLEPMLIRGDPERRRLVQMAIGIPGGYVMQPLVLVDLEAQQVLLENPRAGVSP